MCFPKPKKDPAVAELAKLQQAQAAEEKARIAAGITEEKQTNYKDEESILMEINNEVKSLIVELENKNDEAQA